MYVVYEFDKWTLVMSNELFKTLKKTHPEKKVTLTNVDDHQQIQAQIKDIESWTDYRNREALRSNKNPRY